MPVEYYDYLEEEILYMNTATGSVAAGKEWLEDFKHWAENLDIGDLWSIWNETSQDYGLVAVELVNGEYQEIKE